MLKCVRKAILPQAGHRHYDGNSEARGNLLVFGVVVAELYTTIHAIHALEKSRHRKARTVEWLFGYYFAGAVVTEEGVGVTTEPSSRMIRLGIMSICLKGFGALRATLTSVFLLLFRIAGAFASGVAP